ncbi:MAG: hypothetical protein WB698_08445 [Solirubrobacteraceae bacterium]
MPTTRPRHTVTETPRVQEALDELRTEMRGDAPIDFGELVILGARAQTRRLRAEQHAVRAVGKRLAGMIRDRSMPFSIDVDAADNVKRLGLLDSHR